MKANEYFKKYGIYSAKRLVETAPLDKREIPNITYEKGNAHWGGSSLAICVDVQKLKRLIESHELVGSFGGLEKSKAILNRSPSNAESYQDGYYFRTKPEFLFHNGFHHWNMTTNNGQWFKDLGFNPVLIVDLKQAIADVESCQ